MYLWNTKALAKELKEGTLSESEKFKYYFLSIFYYQVIIEVSIYSGNESFTLMNIVSSILFLSIIFLGIYISYRANNKGDGVLFMERIICLTIPISINFLILGILLSIIFYVLVSAILKYSFPEYDADSIYDNYVGNVLSLLIAIGIYYKLYKYLKFVSGADSGNTNS